MGEVVFCAINVEEGIAVDDGGAEHPIIDMYDADGDLTSAHDAVTLVIQMPNGVYAIVDMNEFVNAPTH